MRKNDKFKNLKFEKMPFKEKDEKGKKQGVSELGTIFEFSSDEELDGYETPEDGKMSVQGTTPDSLGSVGFSSLGISSSEYDRDGDGKDREGNSKFLDEQRRKVKVNRARFLSGFPVGNSQNSTDLESQGQKGEKRLNEEYKEVIEEVETKKIKHDEEREVGKTKRSESPGVSTTGSNIKKMKATENELG